MLLGPRQTGKTTLINRLPFAMQVSFIRPDIRQRYEQRPGMLSGEVEALKRATDNVPLVILDEVQRVPAIFDVVQDLIDRRIANFILSGSSARKIRRGPAVNLLPGRVITLHLDPLMQCEGGDETLENILLYGSLPAIYSESDNGNRELDLGSYATAYLEAEVRSEALVRNVGVFGRFLELAAAESGKIMNFHRVSQDLGVSHTTITSYFEILEDCLIIEKIDPITRAVTRKKLTKSQKYLFFDMGVRRLAAKEGPTLMSATKGFLLEQYVGIEIIRCLRLTAGAGRLRFWRDPDGPEVDWVIDTQGKYYPIEVKWTDSPTTRDIRHLRVFLDEYENASHGFVVCRTPRRIQLDERVTALPWRDIDRLVLDELPLPRPA